MIIQGDGPGPKKWVCAVLKFLRAYWKWGFLGFAWCEREDLIAIICEEVFSRDARRIYKG